MPEATGASNHYRLPSPPSTTSESQSSIISPTEDESKNYYAGLPSRPVLVARSSSTPWLPPTGPEAYTRPKELRVVGEHRIAEVWEGGLCDRILNRLDELKVQWNSVDVVRIGWVGESAPVVVWVAVERCCLPPKEGRVVAQDLRSILQEHDITDVEVEIREAQLLRSGRGPKLLPVSFSSDAVVNVARPLTATLGHPICAEETPEHEGTGGFYLETSDKKLYLITARHVVYPRFDQNEKVEHRHNGQPRKYVNHLGLKAYEKLVENVDTEISRRTMLADQFLGRLQQADAAAEADEMDRAAINKEQETAKTRLNEAKEAIAKLEGFRKMVTSTWRSLEDRRLGHVVFAPPIGFGVGEGRFTEDFALIELDWDKFDLKDFKGNVIDLGTEIDAYDLTMMMYPNVKDAPTFKYPVDRLLKLAGTIPVKEMLSPSGFDQDGEQCLMVIKRGYSTGLTVGRANNVLSRTRTYCLNKLKGESREWAILPRSTKSKPFSEPGDSGAVIVDGLGRLGGLLTGGSGQQTSIDITYGTPVDFILERLRASGFAIKIRN